MTRVYFSCFDRNNKVFTEAVDILSQFPDLDKLLSGLTNVPKTLTPNTVRAGIDTLIGIKHTLKLAKSLANLLGTVAHAEIVPAESDGFTRNQIDEIIQHSFLLFKEMMRNFTDSALDNMERDIGELLAESTTFSKSAHEMRYQECFAVKSGVHGLLDIARQSYLSTVEEIHRVSPISILFN